MQVDFQAWNDDFSTRRSGGLCTERSLTIECTPFAWRSPLQTSSLQYCITVTSIILMEGQSGSRTLGKAFRLLLKLLLPAQVCLRVIEAFKSYVK